MDIKTFILADDGIFPNNPQLPLLWYRQAVADETVRADTFEDLFRRHGWGGSWRNGVYSYQHYHSTAHEVLGVYSGSATVQLGGETGITAQIKTGDVVVIPAGVAHKRLQASVDFRVVGAYPRGQRPDICRGQADERPGTDQNIARVAKPQQDPVQGQDGSLRAIWK